MYKGSQYRLVSSAPKLKKMLSIFRPAVRKLSKEYEKWGLKINLEKTFYMGCWAETKNLILENQKGCIRGCEEFKYLGIIKIDKEDRQENYIKNRINRGRAITAMLNGVLWNK